VPEKSFKIFTLYCSFFFPLPVSKRNKDGGLGMKKTSLFFILFLSVFAVNVFGLDEIIETGNEYINMLPPEPKEFETGTCGFCLIFTPPLVVPVTDNRVVYYLSKKISLMILSMVKKIREVLNENVIRDKPEKNWYEKGRLFVMPGTNKVTGFDEGNPALFYAKDIRGG
jgi:hypothetical protein